jgi:hypothetical protein
LTIQIKTHTLLPQAQVTVADFVYPVYRPFGLLAPEILNDLAFQSIDFEHHLMNVIPEIGRVH